MKNKLFLILGSAFLLASCGSQPEETVVVVPVEKKKPVVPKKKVVVPSDRAEDFRAVGPAN